MDKKEWLKYGAVAAVVLIVWLIWRNRSASSVVPLPVQDVAGDSNSSFYAPYYEAVPGSNSNPPNFTSNITVNVEGGVYGNLSNAYIPLFGFVGVTAVGR